MENPTILSLQEQLLKERVLRVEAEQARSQVENEKKKAMLWCLKQMEQLKEEIKTRDDVITAQTAEIEQFKVSNEHESEVFKEVLEVRNQLFNREMEISALKLEIDALKTKNAENEWVSISDSSKLEMKSLEELEKNTVQDVAESKTEQGNSIAASYGQLNKSPF
jgi:hypothetical protein